MAEYDENTSGEDVVAQEDIITGEQDNISDHSDTFPGDGRETFTSESYTSEKLGPDALAEDLGEAGKSGAVMYIQHKVLGTISHRTSRFFLTNMGIGLQEKSQILETFGTSNVSFFGSKTQVYNFSGVALDWKSSVGTGTEYFQASSLLHMYNSVLRGTALVKNNSIAVIKCMNHTIFGYPLLLQVTYDQNNDKFAGFSLSFVVTKHLLSVPGIVSDSELKANYAPIQKTNIDSVVATAIERVNNAVAACMTATTVDSGDTENYGVMNDLVHKNVEELRKIFEVGKSQTNLNTLRDHLIDLRDAGDGQVSPFISQIFGASEELIEA